MRDRNHKQIQDQLIERYFMWVREVEVKQMENIITKQLAVNQLEYSNIYQN